MTMNAQLAANVRRHRVAAGLSQEELAERTGLSQTWISRLEKGTANPTMETLKSLAEAFSIGVQELFEEQMA
jgi:transcriptional regulator with XRE-family HTH domain